MPVDTQERLWHTKWNLINVLTAAMCTDNSFSIDVPWQMSVKTNLRAWSHQSLFVCLLSLASSNGCYCAVFRECSLRHSFTHSWKSSKTLDRLDRFQALLISNQDKQFISSFGFKFCNLTGVEISLSSEFHLRTNCHSKLVNQSGDYSYNSSFCTGQVLPRVSLLSGARKDTNCSIFLTKNVKKVSI